jgi:predicted amidohydrolase YtcJ|tara:strand:+ start:1488 stop:3137 length:1650 start_codon:yes stop_codon:yes gene_type:complete
MTRSTTIFSAKKILTMNSYQPVATHVAVRDSRILGVGSLDELGYWGDYTLNEIFADKILVPGFVEAHCHAMNGSVWENTYVGFFDRTDPNGRLWPGIKTLDGVVERLIEIEHTLDDPEETLVAWGFDPIYFTDGVRMNLEHLDQVSRDRRILVQHSNGHLLNASRKVLELAGIDSTTDVEGVMKDADGDPTGELGEMAAQFMAYKVTDVRRFDGINSNDLWTFAKTATNVGVTTATDLHARVQDQNIQSYVEVTKNADYPLRLVPAAGALTMSIQDGPSHVAQLKQHNNDKLYLGLCKIMTDGSIQGFTGRLKWPGYINGKPNGIWNLPPQTLTEMVEAYHAAGLQMHMHTNGDEASELMINAIEAALHKNPRPDHRHTLTHCQMADESQFRRMAQLGICSNLFTNHIYYWGDQHYSLTMGPDRATRMDACGTAKRLGVPYTIHSDAPVTPLDPLFTAWCAVNRQTASGRILGPNECIEVDDALRAITLGAAYTLHLDHLIGSIEIGKFADFAVLEQDPTELPPENLKDVPIWGTVVDGIVRSASGNEA